MTPTSGTFASLSGHGPTGPQSSSTGGASGGGHRFPTSSGFAMIAVVLAFALSRIPSKRFAFVAMVVLVALYAGCGSEETSAQTVNGITATNSDGPVTMTGLPGSLGTVSRPEPLVFPGAKSS